MKRRANAIAVENVEVFQDLAADLSAALFPGEKPFSVIGALMEEVFPDGIVPPAGVSVPAMPR